MALSYLIRRGSCGYSKFNCPFETKGLLKLGHSQSRIAYTVNVVIFRKQCKTESLLWITNRK